MTPAEYRRMLEGGLDTWSALKEAGYEQHAHNVYLLRRFAIENPPPAEDRAGDTCACGCGRPIVQAARGRPRRYWGDHRNKTRKARKGTMSS